MSFDYFIILLILLYYFISIFKKLKAQEITLKSYIKFLFLILNFKLFKNLTLDFEIISINHSSNLFKLVRFHITNKIKCEILRFTTLS